MTTAHDGGQDVADMPPYPDSSGDTADDAGVGPDHGSTSSRPRWVNVVGVIAIVLVLLVGILLLTGGHGPGRHMPSDETGSQTPSAQPP